MNPCDAAQAKSETTSTLASGSKPMTEADPNLLNAAQKARSSNMADKPLNLTMFFSDNLTPPPEHMRSK